MVNLNNEDWLVFKQEGNDFFRKDQLKEAVKSYSKGVRICDSENDKVVLYKNRSACYLKLEQYQECIKDTDAVLNVFTHDVKALFRRCQANEALENIEVAFKDIKLLIKLEPKNNAIQQMHRRLSIVVQEMVKKRHSTSSMINEMVESISNPNETPERMKQALGNLVVYSHQSGGRDILLKGGYLMKLLPIMSDTAEKCQYFMKICHGFCENNLNQSLMVVSSITTKRLMELAFTYCDNVDFITSTMSFVLAVLKAMCDHCKNLHPLAPEHYENNHYIRESLQLVRESLQRIPQYKEILEFLVALLVDKRVPADVRDAILDAFIQAIQFHKSISDFIINNRGIVKMLELGSTSAYAVMKKEMPIAVNADTYCRVAVALCNIYEGLDYDEKGRKKFEDQSESIIKIFLESENPNTTLQGIVALSTLIMANREVGNIIANKNDNMCKVIKIVTDLGDDITMNLGGEVLALAATDKDVCNVLSTQGLPTMRKLYQSKNPDIRVKGLVALCKVCMKGSGNVKDQILADGGASKLYKSCKKFLLSDKELNLKKWAAEGLAYLTMDADIKEMLVADAETLNGLVELSKSCDSTVVYSIVGIFVNLTNSYDKPEKNPELEEVAKFAKHNLPQPHEKDSEEYGKNRLKILVENGLISSLVNFGDVKSKNSKEMIARVFSAIVDIEEYRGKVVAEGGVKALLPLTENGTPKGMDIAAQALAKIGITNDPRLAFSGQRCMEVVRPLVRLLNFNKDQLHRFEALMALTNLASMNDDVRRRIMKEKGFREIETCMFEDEDDLRRAAVECMCNLVQNEEAFNKFKEWDCEVERLKFILLCCGEDPPELSQAAAGCLSILTADAEVCKKVMEIKSTLELMKFLLLSENLGTRHRGLYIMANLLASEKEVAEVLVKDEIFDIILAYNAANNVGDEKMAKTVIRCIEAAQKWELIQQNPDK